MGAPRDPTHAAVSGPRCRRLTGTANWQAIRTGVLSLANRNASIINMSLGVSGNTLHPDWRRVFFDPAVYNVTRD